MFFKKIVFFFWCDHQKQLQHKYNLHGHVVESDFSEQKIVVFLSPTLSLSLYLLVFGKYLFWCSRVMAMPFD